MTSYDDIPAGPELDALIRQKFIKLPACDTWRRWHRRVPEYIKEGECDHDKCGPVEVWRYSTTMEAAWSVMTKIAAEGGCPSLINDDFGHWAVSQDGMQPCEEKFVGDTMFFIDDASLWCDTAPLAICRYAMRIVADIEEAEE